MKIADLLLEKTVTSSKPQVLIDAFHRLIRKHLYTRAAYELDTSELPFDSWVEANIDKHFDFQISAEDPRRVSFDNDGTIALLKAMNIISTDNRQEQMQEMRTWLTKFAKPFGWFLFRVTPVFVMLDPISQDVLDIPSKIYHFSPAWNKDSILKKGIIPRKGNYGDDYMYPPRVHVVLKRKIGSIRKLAGDIFSHDARKYDGGKMPPIVVFEIDTSKLNRGTRFYSDTSVDDGAWTYTHIPPSAIRIIYEGEAV